MIEQTDTLNKSFICVTITKSKIMADSLIKIMWWAFLSVEYAECDTYLLIVGDKRKCVFYLSLENMNEMVHSAWNYCAANLFWSKMI